MIKKILLDILSLKTFNIEFLSNSTHEIDFLYGGTFFFYQFNFLYGSTFFFFYQFNDNILCPLLIIVSTAALNCLHLYHRCHPLLLPPFHVVALFSSRR